MTIKPIELKSENQSSPLLIDMIELSRLTSISVRTLRRLDANREIPGRVSVRRCVRYYAQIVHNWIAAGLPHPDRWPGLGKRQWSH